MTVGAALALKGSGRIPIGLLGDGDFLMGNTAVWTAAHYQIPCLMIVCNNRSFYNDERHQGRMAAKRGRPAENRWIGQRIDDPDIDIAAMARTQGALGIGPVDKARRRAAGDRAGHRGGARRQAVRDRCAGAAGVTIRACVRKSNQGRKRRLCSIS